MELHVGTATGWTVSPGKGRQTFWIKVDEGVPIEIQRCFVTPPSAYEILQCGCNLELRRIGSEGSNMKVRYNLPDEMLSEETEAKQSLLLMPQ